MQGPVGSNHAANLIFASDVSLAPQLVHNHGPGYAKTLTVFVPKLLDAGAKEVNLHEILVDNLPLSRIRPKEAAEVVVGGADAKGRSLILLNVAQ